MNLLTRIRNVLVVMLPAVVLIAGLGFGLMPSPLANAQTLPVKKSAQPTPNVPALAAEHGTIEGRITDIETGKPIAGARVRVLVDGVGEEKIREAVSQTDGRYVLTIPLGHARLWGVHAPAGYYTQASVTLRMAATSRAEPRVVQDFELRSGTAWRVRLRGLPINGAPWFSAMITPGRRRRSLTGSVINVTGDAQGNAVLTIPPGGGHYSFTCKPGDTRLRYKVDSADLQIDPGFDPNRIDARSDPQPDVKAVRLRDKDGHTAVIDGVDLRIEEGKAVLCFDAEPIPSGNAVSFRGTIVDSNKEPIGGAKVTLVESSRGPNGLGGGSMTHWTAMTDAQGKFQLADVTLAEWAPDEVMFVNGLVVKSGFDGAETKKLKLVEVENSGIGDFGTIVLKPGYKLHGKVVDENGQPVEGAVVTNLTNYLLYSHLLCRTDAKGRFEMPDLPYGEQKLEAQYGERGGNIEFQFDPGHSECIITVSPIPPMKPFPPPPGPPIKPRG